MYYIKNKIKELQTKDYKLQTSFGFTLVELLVVVSIMSVLMAIVVGNFSNTRKVARDARRISDMKRLQLALATYFSVNISRQYPIADNLSTSLVGGGYIDSMPTDPSTNQPYIYMGIGSNGKCNNYYIAATLEDPSSKYLKDSATFNNNPSIVCTTGTDTNNRALITNIPVSNLYLASPNN